jgi:hypothetical protein
MSRRVRACSNPSGMSGFPLARNSSISRRRTASSAPSLRRNRTDVAVSLISGSLGAAHNRARLAPKSILQDDLRKAAGPVRALRPPPLSRRSGEALLPRRQVPEASTGHALSPTAGSAFVKPLLLPGAVWGQHIQATNQLFFQGFPAWTVALISLPVISGFSSTTAMARSLPSCPLTRKGKMPPSMFMESSASISTAAAPTRSGSAGFSSAAAKGASKHARTPQTKLCFDMMCDLRKDCVRSPEGLSRV